MEKVIGFNAEYKIVENAERGVMYVEQVAEGRRINTIRIDDAARAEWIAEMCNRFGIALTKEERKQATELVCDMHGHDKWMLEIKKIANGYLLVVSKIFGHSENFVTYYADSEECFNAFVAQVKELTGWDINYDYESIVW